MKRVTFLLAGVLPLLLVALSSSSPLTGKRNLGVKRIEGTDFITFKEKFRGGERACILVKGDHNPVVDLAVAVYDENDRLVVKDDAGGEYVAAIWYPPRDAVYKIKILNSGTQHNMCYVSLK
jgi:hypothetical protein